MERKRAVGGGGGGGGGRGGPSDSRGGGGGRRKGRKEVRMDRCVVRWGRWRWEAKEGDVLSIGSK
jgi:hypothetical protein